VPAPRAWRFCTCCLQVTGHVREPSLTPHLPSSVQRLRDSEQQRHKRLSVYYITEITLTKPRLSFVAPRCTSRHPDDCDICSYSHLQIHRTAPRRTWNERAGSLLARTDIPHNKTLWENKLHQTLDQKYLFRNTCPELSL